MFHLVTTLLLLLTSTATAKDLTIREASDQMLFAAAAGQLAAVKEFLKKGANINYLQDSTGSTALMLAAKSNHIELLTFLLEQNANVNMRDSSGGTALFGAATNGFVEVADMLMNGKKEIFNVGCNLCGKFVWN